MKKTKNMVYNATQEARELFCFATNTRELHTQICAIVHNLARKYSKGIYDAEKAAAAFYPVATAASNLYCKWFGYKFSVQDRYTAAVDMVEYFTENIIDNDI